MGNAIPVGNCARKSGESNRPDQVKKKKYQKKIPKKKRKTKIVTIILLLHSSALFSVSLFCPLLQSKTRHSFRLLTLYAFFSQDPR